MYVCNIEKEGMTVSLMVSSTTCAGFVGVQPSDTRPRGIRLPVIISPCQSPGPKRDLHTRHHTANHPWTFSVCVIVIIRVIFFETIFFLPGPYVLPGSSASIFICFQIPKAIAIPCSPGIIEGHQPSSISCICL